MFSIENASCEGLCGTTPPIIPGVPSQRAGLPREVADCPLPRYCGHIFSTRPAGRDLHPDKPDMEKMTEQKHAETSRQGRSANRPATTALEGAFGTLIPEICRAVSFEGYVTPTPIQEKCISHLLAGRDLIGTAQTGTGKTAAYALPMLQRLSAEHRRPSAGAPRALVIAPTRELAAQIGESIRAYGRHLRLSSTVVFGGVNQARQVAALGRGVDILVATPGRLLDLMGQEFIHLEKVEIFVLDEVDRMLDMGFIPDIRRILAHIPSERQTMFFSATMPPDIEELANTMVRDPVRVAVSQDRPTVDLVIQRVLFVDREDKDALLVALLGDPGISRVLVFTRMKHTANKVVKKLSLHGIQAEAIHGNKSQSARTFALEEFRQGRCRVLVATDLAARGLDIDDISHVINYDLPVEPETYIHRIGRTARAGASGDAISFCTLDESGILFEIERIIGERVPIEMEHPYHSEKALQATRWPRSAPSSRPAFAGAHGGYARPGRSAGGRYATHCGRGQGPRR